VAGLLIRSAALVEETLFERGDGNGCGEVICMTLALILVTVGFHRRSVSLDGTSMMLLTYGNGLAVSGQYE